MYERRHCFVRGVIIVIHSCFGGIFSVSSLRHTIIIIIIIIRDYLHNELCFEVFNLFHYFMCASDEQTINFDILVSVGKPLNHCY